MTHDWTQTLGLLFLLFLFIGAHIGIIHVTMGLKEAAENFRAIFSKNPMEYHRKKKLEKMKRVD